MFNFEALYSLRKFVFFYCVWEGWRCVGERVERWDMLENINKVVVKLMSSFLIAKMIDTWEKEKLLFVRICYYLLLSVII